MNSDTVVHLEAGDFKWTEIPEHGRCLVPYVEPPKVTASDVQACKTYRGMEGHLCRFIQLVNKEYQILNLQNGHIWMGGVNRQKTAKKLAAYVSRTPNDLCTAFDRWVD